MRLLPAPPILIAAAALAASGCTRAPATGSLPADAVVSIGVIAAGGLIPQVSGPVTLAFGAGRAAPGQVPAHRFAMPPNLDGDAAEWSGWPATEVALVPAGQAVGLSGPGWYCRWRTHHRQVIDPATGLPACPTPCDPDAPPATQAAGSAGCSVPLPPYDQGVASVLVRAGFDDQSIYLLLQWSAPAPHEFQPAWRWDPAAGAWRLVRSLGEDAAYLSFAIGDGAPAHATRGCALACHVAAAPTFIAPPSPTPTPWPPPGYLADFSCHTDAAGERLDAWAWRAATTAPYGLADDLRIEAAGPAGDRCGTVDGPACAVACAGLDGQGPLTYPCSRGAASDNLAGLPGQPFLLAAGGGGGEVGLDPPYLVAQPGDLEPGWDPRYLAWPPPAPPGTSPAPFPAPTGAGPFTLPGTVRHRPSPHRDDVRAAARWSGGIWTLELARRRLTGDPDDAQFTARRPGASPGGGAAWSALSAAIFVPRCATTACHAGGPPPPSGVPVSLDAGVGWSQLVSAPSAEAPLRLVEPGQPAASYLVNKLRGTQASVGGWGDRMPPPSAGEPLTEEQVLSIEAWISSGATHD
jgi:hypothetical protein